MPYNFIERDGITDVMYSTNRRAGKSKEVVIGRISDRTFKRLTPEVGWSRLLGGAPRISYVQSLGAFRALQKGLIGPL